MEHCINVTHKGDWSLAECGMNTLKSIREVWPLYLHVIQWNASKSDTTVKHDSYLVGFSRAVGAMMWYVPNFSCFRWWEIWRHFSGKSFGNNTIHESDMILVECFAFRQSSSQPACYLKGLLPILRKSGGLATERKGNFVMIIIRMTSTSNNYL